MATKHTHRYLNPSPLPTSVEEASKNFYDWLAQKEAERESSQGSLIPEHTITPVRSWFKRTRYHVSGSYTSLLKGYTSH